MDAGCWKSPQTFQWVQPKISGSFVLTLEGQELGTMAKPSWLSSDWHGESEFGCWRFSGEGMWSRRYVVRDRDSDQVLGTFVTKWHASDGVFSLPDGRSFHWHQKSWFRGTFDFLDRDERVVLEIQRGRLRGKEQFSDLFRKQGTITTNPGRLEPATLALIVFVAWFLIIVQNEEAAAVAATTAAVS